MYRKLIRTKFFIKDSAKVKFSDQYYSKLIIYIAKLLSDEILPEEAQDHQLKGELKEYREFHISGDLLVIYKVDAETLYLYRIGTHSQLFK